MTMLISGTIVLSYTSLSLSLPSQGAIITKGVAVYWTPTCDIETINIDWGVIRPGSSENIVLYIQSVSNQQMFLELSTSNIEPSKLSEYIDLSWDYDGTLLDPAQTIPVTLSLSVSDEHSLAQYLYENKVKDFTIDIYISVH
ncbi:MAG: hypothetical protein QCH99_03830 [Candidatus Bathyarchaeota archaeon]|nr:hypothetical protein [Candidatus Bathyarchaeum tardum]